MDYLILFCSMMALYVSVRTYVAYKKDSKPKPGELTDREKDQVRQIISLMTYIGDSNENKH